MLLSVPDSVCPVHSLAYFVYFHAQINDGGDFNGQLQNVMFVFVSDDDNAMNVAYKLQLVIGRSQVQFLLEATLRSNLRQVVHTYVPLSPSSITWYQPKGGDAVWLGR